MPVHKVVLYKNHAQNQDSLWNVLNPEFELPNMNHDIKS